MNKIDEELANCIEEAIANSNGDYCSALDKVVEWKKQNRGLTGIHISTPLDVLCGTRKVEDPVNEANNMAHDVLMIERARALGQVKEITCDGLERM